MATDLQIAARKIVSVNPATGEVLRELECAGEGEVEAAVARAGVAGFLAGAAVEDGDDGRVVERAGEAGLVSEAVPEGDALDAIRTRDLHGHGEPGGADPRWWLLKTLARSVGLPFFALSAMSLGAAVVCFSMRWSPAIRDTSIGRRQA